MVCGGCGVGCVGGLENIPVAGGPRSEADIQWLLRSSGLHRESEHGLISSSDCTDKVTDDKDDTDDMVEDKINIHNENVS